jgi:hypothetical protein
VLDYADWDRRVLSEDFPELRPPITPDFNYEVRVVVTWHVAVVKAWCASSGAYVGRCVVPHPAAWVGSHESRLEVVMQYVRKLVADETSRRVVRGKAAEAWVKAHPALWEYLTVDRYEDGSPRQPSMLCLFCEDGFIKLALQDRQEGRSLWVSAESIPEAVELLEGNLSEGRGEWRRSRQGGSATPTKNPRRSA